MGEIRLGVSALTRNIYAGKLDDDGLFIKIDRANVTEDFKRCIVRYCSESVVFEVDGMKFEASCERID